MFNVMVVEDSKPIARNIKKQIETVHDRLRVTVVAHNGLEALDGLRRQPIDLVVTDIRMPKMDGLTFIREARSVNPDLTFLILSGYSDFEYARQAIRLGVREYLLKPLDMKELSETLDRVVRQLTGKFHERLARDLSEFIVHGQPDISTLWPSDWKSYRLAVVRIGYFKTSAGIADRGELQQLFRQCLPDRRCLIASSSGKAEHIAVIDCTDGAPDLELRIRLFHGRLQSAYRLAYVACGPAEERPERVVPIYKMLTRHLDLHIKPGLPQCWFVKELQETDVRQPDESDEQAKAKCLAFVRNNRAEALRDEIDRLVAHWEKHQFSVSRIKIWLYELFSDLHAVFHQDLVDDLLAASESYRDIGCFVLRELYAVMKRDEPKHDLIQAINHFFRTNLHRQISMGELCQALNYSPTYIIRVVKQHFGMTPMEYFNKMKIDEARRMLDSSDSIKIKDIADTLGFSNQHYFSKVFKQYVGCNPTDYKSRRSAGDDC